MQSWATVMTVREPPQLVLSNVIWHLETGAAEVHVCFDDPDDGLADDLEQIPGVFVRRCDDAHWRALAPRRKRPDSINRRQSLNANHALGETKADWLFHIDADEFLWQQSPLGAELEVVAELDCELHLPVAERLYPAGATRATIFDGFFRTSTKGLNRRADGTSNDPVIFGDHLAVLLHGVLGHSAGKCGVRRGAGHRLGIHWSYKGDTRHRTERYKSTSTRLLHFDGLTPLHWLSKLIRYRDTDPEVMNIADHRKEQIGLMQAMISEPDGLRQLHDELRVFDEARLQRLRAFGLLAEIGFDPAPVFAKWGVSMPDLTPEAFDAALLAQNPELQELQAILHD
ncbi:glycosyltransferase family 2 protein [Pacificoceanicola onchidii]|uniref:glycosyltransferase family 2 protein n=1 Tax=Pacificoceanicola onchidii TaxID=2562685 RepID=UPI0010A601D9|nr:glycosyltransferase family 2 protein [Pacificoceanicola onchidii]